MTARYNQPALKPSRTSFHIEALRLRTMAGRSSPSPAAHPAKRARQSVRDRDSPPSLVSAGAATSPIGETALADSSGPDAGGQGSGAGASKGGQSSNFRNVSACNRCRLRKNRCDQRLPSCASCEKANVSCVGYDPITKSEIPRRLVACLVSYAVSRASSSTVSSSTGGVETGCDGPI